MSGIYQHHLPQACWWKVKSGSFKIYVDVYCSSAQGVATYMSHIEVFASAIEIESSDQSPVWRTIKVASELLKSMDQEHVAAIRPLTLWKSSDQVASYPGSPPPKSLGTRLVIKILRREQPSTFLPIKNLHPGHKHFDRRHTSDYTSCGNPFLPHVHNMLTWTALRKSPASCSSGLV